MNTTAIKERPILFSGDMVRAILDGRKTQTREVMKPQPTAAWLDRRVNDSCPCGRLGDRLWVREWWSPWADEMTRQMMKSEDPAVYAADFLPDTDPLCVGGSRRWRPPIYMPRWASRILLEITDVRAERVQDITEADAIAEGVEYWDGEVWDGQNFWSGHELPPLRRFAAMWDSTQARRGYPWASNPRVWVLMFKVLEANR